MAMSPATPTLTITPDTAGDFLRAGSVALGAGSALVSRDILQTRDWPALTARAARFVESVRAARPRG